MIKLNGVLLDPPLTPDEIGFIRNNDNVLKTLLDVYDLVHSSLCMNP